MVDQMLVWLEKVHEDVEAIARAANVSHPGEWMVDTAEETTIPNSTYVVDGCNIGVAVVNGVADAAANILVFNQPRALLARLLAERKIIAMYRRAVHDAKEGDWVFRPDAQDESRHLGLAVQRLAEGWQHMPGWDERWVASSITCPFCGWTSISKSDIDQRYCGNCHMFHDPAGLAAEHMRP